MDGLVTTIRAFSGGTNCSKAAKTRVSADHAPVFLSKAYVAPYASQTIRAFEMAPESIGLLAGFLA